MPAHMLENALLQVTVLPESGGKISSLRSVRTGEEFLLPPLQPGLASTPEHHAAMDFSLGDLGGFDECMPSVSACGSIGGEAAVPDHGDLWRLPWTVESSSPQCIRMAVSTTSRPFRFRRSAALEGDKLVLDYEVTNTSEAPATWLWSGHPLLKVEAGDRIVLPPDIARVEVGYASTSAVTSLHRIQWPIARSLAGGTHDLDMVPSEDGVTAYKLFVRLGTTGEASLYRSRFRQGLAFHFDSLKLPFLGLWISAGAWPESGRVKQYTVAIEPTTSPRDSLSEAAADGLACLLAGGASTTWRVVVQLLGAAAPYSLPSRT